MMENPLFNLKSSNAQWLSPSSTTMVLDMILAVVCGVGLFLLLLPFLNRKPPLPPPEGKKKQRKDHLQIWRWKKSRKKHIPPKASGVHLKEIKEKEQNGSCLEQMSPKHHLNPVRDPLEPPSTEQDDKTPQLMSPEHHSDSAGDQLESPSAEQDDKTPQLMSPEHHSDSAGDQLESPSAEKDDKTPQQMSPGHHSNPARDQLESPSTGEDNKTPRSFWDTKDKSEHLQGPQQLSLPKITDDDFQKKYDQLFWGLPSLHSESLVATAWIPQNSPLQSPFFLFNGTSIQDKISPLLSQVHPLSHLESQPPSLILPISQFQPSSLDHVHQSSLPSLPSSLHHLRDYGTSFSVTQSKVQFFSPTEIHYPEKSLLRRQLEPEWDFPSVVQTSQLPSCPITPSPSQESWAVSILPENLPISPELRGKLEQHIQKWLVQHGLDLPRRIQESLEAMDFQEELTRTCSDNIKPGPSCSFMSTSEQYKEVQKVKFHLDKEVGKNLGHILGRAPKYPSKEAEDSPVKTTKVNSKESLKKNDSVKNGSRCRDKNLSRGRDKNLQNDSKSHLAGKLGRKCEVPRPVSMPQPWLPALPMPNTHRQTKRLEFSETMESCEPTFRKLSFLDACTHQALEAHIIKLWVKHRWSLPLKALKPINVFKLRKPQLLALPHFSGPSSSTCVSKASSKVQVAKFLGKPPQASPKEKVMANSSVPQTLTPLSPSPSCKETERLHKRIPYGDAYGSSPPPPTRAEGKWAAPVLTGSHVHSSCRRKSVVGTGQGGLEVPTRSATHALRKPCFRKEVTNEFEQRQRNAVIQASAYVTGVTLPHCNARDMPLAASYLAPHMSEDVMMETPCSSGQHQPHVVKCQDTWRNQPKMYAFTYKGEEYRRPTPRNHDKTCEEMRTPKLTPARRTEEAPENRAPTPAPLENHFQKFMRRFFHWMLPKKTIMAEADTLDKDKPKSAPVRSHQRGQAGTHMDRNMAEAQELMTAVGQIVEKKMMLHHKLCTLKSNQYKEYPRAPNCHIPSYQRPSHYSDQRRMTSYAATKWQRYPTQDRKLRPKQSLKSVRFNEQRGAEHACYPPSKKAVSPPTASPHGPTVPGPSSHHQQHCPRHCHLRRGVLSRSENPSPVLSVRKTCPKGKL
ncbi:spermatogenesis-associated protein 31-like [Dipodomys spectabilis]|uniref:spermatogenesis-associated protein 31-like n=1 Tax=Dipodomys spectabilis TaxID=105255 RepID=UPI001C53E30B|nr:spermatogenesis-associated protein 31-like [Dipodomys spectabilis]